MSTLTFGILLQTMISQLSEDTYSFENVITIYSHVPFLLIYMQKC